MGDWHTNDDDNQQIAMARAQKRAQINAQKKAGVYLKTFSRSVNSELTDEEISAVTNNIIEVFDVHIDKKIIPLNERQTTILYTATLKAKIDPDGIYDYIKRDSQGKVTIIEQNNRLQDAIQKNDELAEKLTGQYNQAASQADKDRIRQQMNDADRDFLANQKYEEGLKLYYEGNFNGAIKLYSEALEINPNYFEAYTNRGNAYGKLRQYEPALQDFNKSIGINPNYEWAYCNRGVVYYDLGQFERAIEDYTQAIKINPNDELYYNNRGNAYLQLFQYKLAIKDYDKAIEFNPNYSTAYRNRGLCYREFGNNKKADADFEKARQLENVKQLVWKK